MSRDRHAVIWTRIGGKPIKMGDLVLSADETTLTYTDEYLHSELPGFCLLGDPAIWQGSTVRYPVSDRIRVFPRLLSLIPGNAPRNLQRRHYLDMIRTRTGKDPAPGIELDWILLSMGGHGGIGHVDVFSDDITANQWYQQRLPRHQVQQANNRSELWAMLKRNVLDENAEFNPQVIEDILGPTPSVGGMIPKLLVSVDRSPGTQFFPPDTPRKVDVVLKVEPPEYAGLLDLESLCLDIHKEAGFEVPWHVRNDDGDLHFLALERFDRKDGIPLPMESFFSVIATGDYNFRETGDLLLDELGDIIDKLSEIFFNSEVDTDDRSVENFLPSARKL